MMRMVPISLADGSTALGVEVLLPKTTLLAVATDKGYIMCGAHFYIAFACACRSGMDTETPE